MKYNTNLAASPKKEQAWGNFVVDFEVITSDGTWNCQLACGYGSQKRVISVSHVAGNVSAYLFEPALGHKGYYFPLQNWMQSSIEWGEKRVASLPNEYHERHKELYSLAA